MGKIIRVLIMLIAMTGVMFACDRQHYEVPKVEVVNVKESPDEVTVMSYNIRCMTTENWSVRVQLIGEGIASVAPDLIGMQEVTISRVRKLDQLDNLKEIVGDEYGCIAYGRDSGNKGEACVIFYKKSRFELLDEGVFWLSETPDEVSRYSGAACNRTAAYAYLKDKVTGGELVYYNTHLDHVSDEARIYGQQVIFDHMQTTFAADMPKILTGDFNYSEGSDCYVTATTVMNDAKYLATTSDSGKTFHGYNGGIDGLPIDFCLLSKNVQKVRSYTILRTVRDGQYASDHYAIYVNLTLPVFATAA